MWHQVGTYDHCKRFILAERWLQEGFAAHCAASMVAGLVAAVATSPVDVLKTRWVRNVTEVCPNCHYPTPPTPHTHPLTHWW
jgi:hypothetical protein